MYLVEDMAGVEGLEPPTLGLEIRCSILLSYTPEPLTGVACQSLAGFRAFGCPFWTPGRGEARP